VQGLTFEPSKADQKDNGASAASEAGGLEVEEECCRGIERAQGRVESKRGDDRSTRFEGATERNLPMTRVHGERVCTPRKLSVEGPRQGSAEH
jgi:hypothetical protein